MSRIWSKGVSLFGLAAITLLVAFLLAPSSAWAASPGLLSESGTEISAADAKEITLDTSNYSCAGFDGSSTDMVEGQEYSITYAKALQWPPQPVQVWP